jgi:hypothetical protein
MLQSFTGGGMSGENNIVKKTVQAMSNEQIKAGVDYCTFERLDVKKLGKDLKDFYTGDHKDVTCDVTFREARDRGIIKAHPWEISL